MFREFQKAAILPSAGEKYEINFDVDLRLSALPKGKQARGVSS